jgi:hypothetical protein
MENPDLVQQILARIQAEAPDGQIISARLLPTTPHTEEAVEVEEVEQAEEAEESEEAVAVES